MQGQGAEALQGPGKKGILSLSSDCGRSTWSYTCGWIDLPRVFISHMGSCWMESCTGSSPPFKPSGYTTWLPHSRSLCTCNWQRYPQVLLLGTPLIMALIWPLLDRGTCKVPSLSCTKAYTQLLPMLISRVSFLATSSREGRHAWCGAPTPWSAQMPSPPQWSCLVLSRDMPYCIGASLCLPTHLCGRGLRPLAKSHLSPGIMIGRDRYHEIPIASGLTPPIGWGLWRSAYSHPLLVIVCKQRKSVIWKAVVSKYLGDPLARVPRCFPPVNWVICRWEVPRCELS